jgi:hypothetical protein
MHPGRCQVELEVGRFCRRGKKRMLTHVVGAIVKSVNLLSNVNSKHVSIYKCWR